MVGRRRTSSRARATVALTGLAMVVALSAPGCTPATASGGTARPVPLLHPLAPPRLPQHSPLELQAVIGPDSGRTRFATEATLRTPVGVVISGRSAILDYLAGGGASPLSDLRIAAPDVYRCGPNRGIEIGSYAGQQRVDDFLVNVGGAWWAEWTRSEGEWRIREARLHAPGERASEPGDCPELAEEIRARSRFTLMGYVSTASYATANPRAGTERLGRYPMRNHGRSAIGGMLGARYRVGDWIGVELSASRLPTVYNRYGEEVRREWLATDADFVAASLGYEGRNIYIGAGPAAYRARWGWSGVEPTTADAEAYSGVGAVVTLHVLVPIVQELGLDVITQYRTFGDHPVPRGDESLFGSHSGFFVALGAAVRSSK